MTMVAILPYFSYYMVMEIEICDNKEEWNKRFLKQAEPEFLQSWEWGEFQEKTGKKALRLQGEEWQGQGVVHRLALGIKYIYFPRLDLGKAEIINNKMINDICESVAGNLKELGFAFIRLESAQIWPPNFLSSIIYHLSPVNNRQPRQTFILDLGKSEAELLAAMHPKTRYNINLAQKKGVVVKEEKNIEIFWKLNQETIKRGQFKSHNKDYYAKMLEMDICRQLIAYYNEKPVASNILIIFNNTGTYLHGASTAERKELMAPYWLQWEGIKLAKKLDCKNYDFWGVAPPASGADKICFHGYCWNKNHPWSGITRFKAGFGGEYRKYPQACDIILRPWQYRMYKLIHKILTKYQQNMKQI